MKRLLIVVLILGLAGIGCKKAKKEEPATTPQTEQVAPQQQADTTKADTVKAEQPAAETDTTQKVQETQQGQ